MLANSDSRLHWMISEHRANTLRLFAEAQQIQRNTRTLPVADRQAAINEVVALETEALRESHQGRSLELELIDHQRMEIWWQNLVYLVNRTIFRVKN